MLAATSTGNMGQFQSMITLQSDSLEIPARKCCEAWYLLILNISRCHEYLHTRLTIPIRTFVSRITTPTLPIISMYCAACALESEINISCISRLRQQLRWQKHPTISGWHLFWVWLKGHYRPPYFSSLHDFPLAPTKSLVSGPREHLAITVHSYHTTLMLFQL